MRQKTDSIALIWTAAFGCLFSPALADPAAVLTAPNAVPAANVAAAGTGVAPAVAAPNAAPSGTPEAAPNATPTAAPNAASNVTPSAASNAAPSVTPSAAPNAAPNGMPEAADAATVAPVTGSGVQQVSPATVNALLFAPLVRSAVAQAAIVNARNFATTDPLTERLLALNEPGWTADPIEVFINSGVGYKGPNGHTVPVPRDQDPALLQEYGCTHVLVENFRRTQRAVQLAIYTFVNADGAYGAYSVLRHGASTVVIRGDASSEDDSSVSFWKGRRLCVISSRNEDDEVGKALVSTLADQIAVAIIGHADVPQMLTAMSHLDRVIGSEKLLLGATAARRFTTFPHIQALSMEAAWEAASVEYQFPPPMAERMKALVVEYGNPQMARRVFAAYNAAIAEGSKGKMLDSNRFLAKVSDSYLLCVLRGSQVAVINGAKRKEAPMMLAVQLAF